ncbi:MAG: hypothetical protein BWY77_01787 [bacterium ADurb.Bin431]|nr:MAG: hypothetical protein BWY77_01787 [bacterium ADurb.Bin431]
MAGGIPPLAGLDVNGGADQAEIGAAVEELDQGDLGLVVVALLAGQFAESAELKQQGADFGRIGDRPAHCAGFEIDEGVGHAGGGIEDGEQAVAQLLRQGEKAGIAVELVGGEQPPERPDGDFEILDGDIVVKVEAVEDEFFRLGRFGSEPH